MLRISVTCGKTKIEYEEPKEVSNYPKIISIDRVENTKGKSTRGELMLSAIKEMADKAAEIEKERAANEC